MSHHPAVNKYRSCKNPERQVVVAELPDGGYSVGILDGKNARLVTAVIGQGGNEKSALKVDHSSSGE